MAPYRQRLKARGRLSSPAGASRRQVKICIRLDGGDAETGLGLETGFGLVFSHPGLGLMVAATLSMLVVHQNSRYDEWGFSGSVRFDPGLAGRGLSLNLTPSFGATAQGADRLWAVQDMSRLVPYGAVPVDRGGQLAADVGYGTTGPSRRGTGTPYAGLTRSGAGHRAMRLAPGMEAMVDEGGYPEIPFKPHGVAREKRLKALGRLLRNPNQWMEHRRPATTSPYRRAQHHHRESRITERP